MRKTRFFFLLASLFAVLCILDYGIGKFLIPSPIASIFAR